MRDPSRRSATRWQTHAAILSLAWILGGMGCGDHEVVQSSPAATLHVARATVSVAGAQPPPNPNGNIATPAGLNRATAQTYQPQGVADADIGRVLVLMPGFLGGAGNFDYLARRVVLRSATPTAVWAVDRRSNGLEDQTGLDAAESRRDADIAKNYYFYGAEVEGRRFGGFRTDADALYLSEWGIRTHIEDLDALISAARARYPRAAIFLGGHSLGAAIVPIYAAWDFGDHAGFERLSGLVLLEGAPNPGGNAPPQLAYEETGVSGGLARVSVRSLRSAPIASLQPFVSTDLFVTAEILAMRVHHAFGQPEVISKDSDLYSGFVGLLFGLSDLPPVTNRAALGFGFDNDFQPLSFARVSIGSATGGTIGPNPNAALLERLIGVDDELLAPTDPNATYDWQDTAADDAARRDPTHIDTFAGMLYEGPSNFVEWYFPARLSLDVGVVANLNVQRNGDWRKEVYGMAVTENARVDVPVFAGGGSRGILSNLQRLDPYRLSLNPTLRNGTPRASADGFRALLMDRFVHIDVLSAYDEDAAGNGLFLPLVEWLDAAAQLAPRQ